MKAVERAKRIKMIIMDVDGTLTDGILYVLPDGEEVKGYNVKDGTGILLAHLAGIKTAIITGKVSKALDKRAEKLGIGEVYQGFVDKKSILYKILKKHSLKAEEVAFIGDDIGDLEIMKSVGFAGAVADAHPEIKRISHFISNFEGGKGAVREFIEFILKAQNKWESLMKEVKNLKNNMENKNENKS
ncbi:HAD hydrolase family protein [Candidatus Aminicenantes bacterium AC-335-A11]|jgi:3-deoxy-D-manno-octulosonate 8-phosphate phosphatase (KDO 8-P phosphatase)|nr:HAD hydrolase family protein [SCandidatus Aminicenantes bacterium Aminicenantia_JdfR_composite]MCP2597796.1 HAD hydrolase family protein [Candidatus Aminicenantes bacterium AC-335-L06]MCP2618477.1 HAD hydrolase family protein [Candidatus Aminicenantes bacterium AC-335-A11]MCP2620521.1 HAD hydrolase family protein [Candidatus Aminicenantes bacterium AC-334-E05]